MYVIATVICPNFHFSVSHYVPLLNLLFEQIAYSNEYLLAKIGVDTAKNEPLEVWGKYSILFTDVLITERVLSAAYRARAVLPQPVDDAVPAEEMRARQLRRGVAHDLRLETFFPECSFPPIWILNLGSSVKSSAVSAKEPGSCRKKPE